MMIAGKIRCALEAEICGNMQMALAELYDAMRDTACREYGGSRKETADAEAARFLKAHFPLLLRLWPGMPLGGNIKLPTITNEVWADADGYCFLDELLYWLLRRAGTWKPLPVQWHTEPILNVVNGELHLSTGLAWALTLLITTREVNLDERMCEVPNGADPTVVDMINELWGREEKLTELICQQDVRWQTAMELPNGAGSRNIEE